MATVLSSETSLRTRRDATVRPHLIQYAPVWLIDEIVIPDDEAIQFNVVFQHKYYGWVSRRYRFDGFNDVLYYKGERIISEAEALRIQEQEPYLTVAVPDIPNSYGG